jgi:hypothetical protein
MHDNAFPCPDMMTQAPDHRSNHRSNRRSNRRTQGRNWTQPLSRPNDAATQKTGFIWLVCTSFCSGIWWIGYPYHALKVYLMMQYQANPSTDFFQTSDVVLPWVIYLPYISRFCGDRLATKTLQSPAVWCAWYSSKFSFNLPVAIYVKGMSLNIKDYRKIIACHIGR